MYTPLVINLSFLDYLNFLASFEDKFNNVKEKLVSEGITLVHPCYALPNLDEETTYILVSKFKSLQQLFSNNSKSTYNSMLLINYHIGNLRVLRQIFNPEVLNRINIQVSIEEFMVLDTFKKANL